MPREKFAKEKLVTASMRPRLISRGNAPLISITCGAPSSFNEAATDQSRKWVHPCADVKLHESFNEAATDQSRKRTPLGKPWCPIFTFNKAPPAHSRTHPDAPPPPPNSSPRL